MYSSRPETMLVVPQGTTAFAKPVMLSLLHSLWMCPSMSPGTRYLPEASMICVPGPTCMPTSAFTATIVSRKMATSAG